MKVIGFITTTFLLAASLIPITSTPAFAGSCTTSEQIFIESGALKSNTRGTNNQILLKDRSLEGSCTTNNFCSSNVVMSLSTAHMNDQASDWVEVGWVETWVSGGNHEWSVFAEKGVNGQITDCYLIQPTPNLQTGTYDQWRISATDQGNGTTDWSLDVNFLIGQSYVHVKTYNTNWGHALARGETERRGDGSGLSDDQKNLQRLKDDGTWSSWPSESCVQHTGTGNLWTPVSANSYTVNTSGSQYC